MIDGDDCLNCPKETYNNVENSTSCIPCPIGSTTESNGTVNEWECGKNSHLSLVRIKREHLPIQ